MAEAIVRARGREAGCPLGAATSARQLAFGRGAASGRVVELGQGRVAEVACGRLRIGPARPGAGVAPAHWGEASEGRTTWGAWELRWRAEPAGAPVREGWRTWVTPGRGVVRAPAPGDRLVPVGGVGRGSASRLRMEARGPRGARAGYPVVARASEILWLPGVCRAAAQVPRAGAPAFQLEVAPVAAVGGAAKVR